MDNTELVSKYGQELDVPMLMADFELAPEDQIKSWGKFSLITMVHVFEHMYDPMGALRKLRELISDDGTLFVRLPDHDVSGFERDLTSSHYMIHPFFYSLSSFLELLARGGDLFTVRQTYPLNSAGQRDLILKPLVKKPLIYAGLIVKNEERDLPRCLHSIEAVADGIVLIDTGSTDATLDVARRTTKLPVFAQMYTDASRRDATGDWRIWDFSQARNIFVREIEARGADYVFWMDADDELLTPDQLRRAIYWDQHDVFGLQIESGRSRWVQHRVWKTRLGIHFQGRCHEYPTYGGHSAHILADAVVRHHAEPGAGESSNDRNLRILLEEFTETPSSRTAFYLANTYRDARRYAEAIPWYERRISFGTGFRDEWLFAHLYKARCQRWMGDFGAARVTAHQALVEAPDWSEFWMELAYGAYDQHDYHGAIDHALHAPGKVQPPTLLLREPDKYTDQPPRLISWCYEHLGDADKALHWALHARNKIGGHDDEWDDRIARLRRGELYEDEDEGEDDGEVNVRTIMRAPGAAVAICRPGAIGDVIMTLNLVPLLRRAWPYHDIHYYCHPSIGSKLQGLILAAGVTEVRDASSLHAGRYTRAFNLIGYPLHEGYPEKPMRRHLLDYYAEELGLDPGAVTPLRLPLPPRPLGTSAPYATLQVKTGWSSYKNWPIERWTEVVRACPEIPIYQIGEASEPLIEGALHDFMGAPLSPTIALFANASLHLGLDSFANHLTHYLWEDGHCVRRVPAIILWGSTQVSAMGYEHNTNISLGLNCQPCFREDPAISRMPRGPCINPPGQSYAVPQHACMGGIDVTRVVSAVRGRWERALQDAVVSGE